MTGRPTALRGYGKIALALLLVSAFCLVGITFADPRVGTPTAGPEPVAASMNASTILSHARANTYAENRQSVRYVRNGPDPDSELEAVWFFRYEPTDRQYHNKLFVAPDSPTENWTLDEVYSGEHVAGERLGDYDGMAPRLSASPTDPASRSGAVWRGIEDDRGVHRHDLGQRPTALRVLNETDEYVVVGRLRNGTRPIAVSRATSAR